MTKLIPYRPFFSDSFLECRAQPLSVRHNPIQAMSKKVLESDGSDLSDFMRYGSYRWFVEYDGVAVGSVGPKKISHSMGYAEIGYGIGEAHQGNGIATAAVGQLVRMCFCESPLRKLLAYSLAKRGRFRPIYPWLGAAVPAQNGKMIRKRYDRCQRVVA